MVDEVPFDREPPEPGRLERLTPLVRRLVAGNGGPFTFTGTCTYVLGTGRVTVLDPGPGDPAHLSALLEALRGEQIDRIVLTHTHRDHADAVAALKEVTGAEIAGCGVHRAARPLALAETDRLDASNNRDYRPDVEMREGDVLSGAGFTLEAMETPGHTMNHLVFALREENAIFSGDHVMAWSTSIVAPPDGSMRAYMESLQKLTKREETVYWPGHGGAVREPGRFVRALLHHRRQREASILDRVAQGEGTVSGIVDGIYQGLAPALRGAARLSVLAHLEDLVGRGLIMTDGTPSLESRFRTP